MSLHAVPEYEESGLDEFADDTKEKDVANDLGSAAQDALEGVGPEDDLAGQEALIPACKVKFQGMAWDSLEEVPSLKDEMVFIVKATVVGHEQYVQQNSGEVRDLAKAKVTSVRLYED